MPRMRNILATLLVVLGASPSFAQQLPPVDPAIAAMTPEQMVETRRNTMRDNGMLVRRAANATGADAVAAATTLLQNFVNLPALFPEGSIVGRSEALPLIWDNWDEFKGHFDRDAQTAAKALAAAEAGDGATYTASLQEIGRSCSGCHQKFRS